MHYLICHKSDHWQSATPCFEGLFLPDTEFDSLVQDMLFTFALWHVLAKLAMHTDSSLALLKGTTCDLANLLRQFRNDSAHKFRARETPLEAQRRVRRATNLGISSSGGRRSKVFNLSTFKFHAMGHYVPYISVFGSTYNYDTAWVSGLVSTHSLLLDLTLIGRMNSAFVPLTKPTNAPPSWTLSHK